MTYRTTHGTEVDASKTFVSAGKRYTAAACDRCGGAGGSAHWPGWTCFGCGGNGRGKDVRVYDDVEYAKLVKRSQSAAARKQVKADAKAAEIAAVNTAYPVWQRLLDYAGSDSFLLDVRARAKHYGLSPKQASAVEAALDREASRAAEDELRGDAPEGRVEVTGQVVSLKWYESEWGSTQKMLVLLDNGAKVFSTVPSKWMDVEVGSRVKVTATWARKERTFATGKRPVGEVLEEVAA